MFVYVTDNIYTHNIKTESRYTSVRNYCVKNQFQKNVDIKTINSSVQLEKKVFLRTCINYHYFFFLCYKVINE